MSLPIKNNISLKDYNSFGLDVFVEHFNIFETVNEAIKITKKHVAPLLIIGGGSNILLTKNQLILFHLLVFVFYPFFFLTLISAIPCKTILSKFPGKI